LFENDVASVAHRKMATFAQLTMTPDWMAPAKIEMRYAPPTARRGSSHRGAGAITAEATSSAPFAAALPSSPASPAIVGDTYVLPATLSRRTIASAITGAQERGEAWDSDPAALVVFMRDGAAAAEVTLRPFSAIKGGTLTDRGRETLETALRAWKEVDQDTLDVLVNNLLENGLKAAAHRSRSGRNYVDTERPQFDVEGLSQVLHVSLRGSVAGAEWHALKAEYRCH